MELSKDDKEEKRLFEKINEQRFYQLMLINWLCNEYKKLSKYSHTLSNLYNKEFTTKDLPLKSSRSHELIKEWQGMGLIKRSDMGSKLHKYKFTPTLFAKVIEKKGVKFMLKMVDELLKIE